MEAPRSLLRIHAHAWFVCGFCFLIFLSFVYLKALQVYYELEVDRPSITSKQERWSKAWAQIPARRLDDPSLWAMIAVVTASWLLTRGAAHACKSNGLPPFIWTRDVMCWVWLVAMLALSTAAYLAVVFLKHETFWFAANPASPKYLNTPILEIQRIEGILNLAAIASACSLVPPIRALVNLVKAGPDAKAVVPLEDINLFKARARLATMAVGPFSLLATAFSLYKIFSFISDHFHGANIPVVDSLFDIASGIAGALFVCSPMMITTWELWCLPSSNRIRLKAIPGVALVIWAAVCLVRRDLKSPPSWLVDDESIPQQWRTLAQVLRFLGALGSGVCLWFIP